MCGENYITAVDREAMAGSSPRVRGKHDLDERHSEIRGLIPACAGKTWEHSRAFASHQAHPRVCGENQGV